MSSAMFYAVFCILISIIFISATVLLIIELADYRTIVVCPGFVTCDERLEKSEWILVQDVQIPGLFDVKADTVFVPSQR